MQGRLSRNGVEQRAIPSCNRVTCTEMVTRPTVDYDTRYPLEISLLHLRKSGRCNRGYCVPGTVVRSHDYFHDDFSVGEMQGGEYCGPEKLRV